MRRNLPNIGRDGLDMSNGGLRRRRCVVGVIKLVDKVKRGRGRSKLTWDESIKGDLKDWNISEEVALDRSAWRLAINVPKS